jgi:hypothetical protein
MLLRRGFTNLHFGGEYGDGLAFPCNSYGLNQTFHSGWEPQWSRSRGKITLVIPFPPFYLEKKKSLKMCLILKKSFRRIKYPFGKQKVENKRVQKA